MHRLPVEQRPDARNQFVRQCASSKCSSNASSQQPPLPMDELSDLIIGLSLTDPGPNVRQQPSKLFSTRDEESIRAVLGSPKYPGINSVKRNKDLLLEVRERVQTARESLLGIDLLFADNNDYNSMRLAVDAAAQVVISAGLHLKTVITSKGEGLAQLRDEILA
ncbi:hypothetical protein B0H14DRAFT_556450 [Mycena olivaceomarginata]|nr:hypothetical protein B0H14DRAFT_556450 [Mycena olivaceomarginata]